MDLLTKYLKIGLMVFLLFGSELLHVIWILRNEDG